MVHITAKIGAWALETIDAKTLQKKKDRLQRVDVNVGGTGGGQCRVQPAVYQIRTANNFRNEEKGFGRKELKEIDVA